MAECNTSQLGNLLACKRIGNPTFEDTEFVSKFVMLVRFCFPVSDGSKIKQPRSKVEPDEI